MMATKTLLTVEQFDRLPEKEGARYELNEGELVTMTEPMPRHNFIRDNIADALKEFVKARKLGKVVVENGYQLTPETVRIPDVSFIPADRMRGIDLDRRIEGAPALPIQVVSPTDLAEDLRRKVEQYLAAGAKAVWVFHPKSREVQVFRANGASFVRREHESLEEPELLPGFSLVLKTVFE
ncbi:MAG TPA: Uma2 family endonuclease [Terriglobia bacterium]|nr:Uma2 family endonuclease [Terriglobia bacterium]